MPLYDYDCARCGPFVSFQSIEERNKTMFCPECHKAAERSISAPRLSMMPASLRKAHAVNERSRHEPRVSRGHQCSSSCGCGPSSAATPIRKNQTVKRKMPETPGYAEFKTARKSNRPWMLGH